MDSLIKINPNAKIITMGDLNDGAYNKSVKQGIGAKLKKEELKKVIHHLKESSLNFMFLTDICGIHYPDHKEKELGVIYHLHNLQENFRIRIKSFFPKDNAEVDSITDLYSGANWMERETYDFYGITFKGHPVLRVILNMEELGYHPLLKEYALEDGTRTDKDDSMFGR